jgi:FtsZ-binding cell division protein ZapB
MEKSAIQVERDSLKQTNGTLRSELETWKNASNELKEAAKTTVETLKNEIGTLRAQHERCLQDLEHAQQERDDLNVRNATLRSELEVWKNASNELKEAAKTTVETLKNEIDTLRAQHERCLQDLEHAQQERDDLNVRNATLR